VRNAEHEKIGQSEERRAIPRNLSISCACPKLRAQYLVDPRLTTT
jgi:hypothetical protein